MDQLYPYQIRARKLLNAGKNVIIQAPTGAGKTHAALLPFFENLDQFADVPYPTGASLPPTCRYTVPMRVLATQFEREYRDYFSRLDRKRGTRFQDLYGKLGISLPSIQTGETPLDPEFESPLTFCTIDQLLASFIGTPYSLGPARANLNVAAAIGSYLILDEFHLYPFDGSGGARLTALAMLRLLNGFCRFTLMTATFSSTLLGELAKLLNAEVVRVEDDEELAHIMHGRQRTIRREDIPMSADAIWTAHQAARDRNAGASLVVCNTVGRAQQIYVQLRDLLVREGCTDRVRLQLLHSRFTPEHRRQKSERLEAWLGQDAWRRGYHDGPDTIVVATQVVEVGLNISAGVLHTEVAPASSIVQRAGRCARFKNQLGDVIVYPLPPSENGKLSYLPYQQKICESTWGALPTSPTSFGFDEEQVLIDAIHTEEDTAFIGLFKASETQLREYITDALTSHEPEHQSKLIRDASSVSVLIHPAPEDTITTKPFDWEAFSLYPGTLEGAWDHLQQRAKTLDLPWVMKELISGGNLHEDLDNDREQPYTWQVVSSKKEIPRALRLVLPPQLAAYDEHLGFRLLLDEQDTSGTWQSAPMNKQRLKRDFSKREQRSYVEHISGLMAAYDWSVHRELAWIASRLEEALNATAGSVDLAMRLAIGCHDIGKLGDDWQRWAHATQQALARRYGSLYEVQPGREFLAKTDALSSWQDEKAVQDSLHQQHITRPPHACAGALAGSMLIAQRFHAGMQHDRRAAASALTRATLTAIAHHHAPTATTYNAISWRDGPVRDVLAQAFSVCHVDAAPDTLDLSPKPSGRLRNTYLVTPAFGNNDERLVTWLAFTLVRALRLCDQRAERDW
jgi:CRISPR-associated endonuclease/helicase Cas3